MNGDINKDSLIKGFGGIVATAIPVALSWAGKLKDWLTDISLLGGITVSIFVCWSIFRDVKRRDAKFKRNDPDTPHKL